MDDDSKYGALVKWGLGATGLGAVAAAVALPRPLGIWAALLILGLFLLCFGTYYLLRKIRARKRSRAFSSAIEAQTAAAPKAISDPNQRAALDKLRQKFQTGMQEFKSRGKDIYKLPWYVIIGESGSGKTEAIRHSGIEFPPGLQDELQGSGGTVNMDWWFTNRGIILDTAGSMLFRETQAGEAPEWREFLRLLKKSRPHCPINGLFLVLSIESLIKDSADKIAEKASRLAQQLDLIQRTLDVRFPVFLLVTKADLLIGFREFFDNIEDPLLQHQMFGWSNPDPLDAHFRPDLVEQHLKSVADRLRRRRMALLLRESSPSFPAARMGETAFFSAGSAHGQRRLDEVDALFALPESVMRLVPRLRRYLETVFVAGEWSAKPVFLRGIYFTSSMREGKALDEAIALATGLSVEDLPEERSWERNRAFFLRDLFVEKVFRESGLVTRATNTIQLLRKRQFAIFGSAGAALLLLIGFAAFGYGNLKRSVLGEAAVWEAGAKSWDQGAWAYPIVKPATNAAGSYTYRANEREIPVGADLVSLVVYQQQLKAVASKPLAVSWIFKPLSWFGFGDVQERKTAQRILFERSVLKPLVDGTRSKLARQPEAEAVARHQNALLSLIQFQAEAAVRNNSAVTTNDAVQHLASFLSYLTDAAVSTADTNLVDVFVWTYSKEGSGQKAWPPEVVVGKENNDLASRRAIQDGLESLRKANAETEKGISNKLAALNQLTGAFASYRAAEEQLFSAPDKLCGDAFGKLEKARDEIRNNLGNLRTVAGNLGSPLTNLARCYDDLAAQAASTLDIESKLAPLPARFKESSAYGQITNQLAGFRRTAASPVRDAKRRFAEELARLDADYVKPLAGHDELAFEVRWSFYRSSCLLANSRVDERVVGNLGRSFSNLVANAQNISERLGSYQGPLADKVSTICYQAIGRDVEMPKARFVESYVRYMNDQLAGLKFPLRLNATAAFTAEELAAIRKNLFGGLEADLNDPIWQSYPASDAMLQPLRTSPASRVATALVTAGGVLAEMEILFTAPEVSSPEGQLYSGFLRYARLFVDGSERNLTGGSRPGDLSSFGREATLVAAKVPVNAGLRFEFFRDVSKTRQAGSFESGENWSLVRLIQAGQAAPVNQGNAWRLRIPVTVEGKAQVLEAFEIRIPSALPAKEDWPK